MKPTVDIAPDHGPKDSFEIIIDALGDMVESTQELVKHHLALAKEELVSDVKEIGTDLVTVILAAGMLLIGYLLLLCCIVLFSSWFGGMAAMAITCFALMVFHMGAGVLALLGIRKTFKARRYGMTYTKDQARRSKAWIENTTSSQSQRQDPLPLPHQVP